MFLKNNKKLLLIFLALITIISSRSFAQIQSDRSDTTWSIVMPESLVRNLDMKQALIGSAKDSLVIDFIINTGKYKFRVDSIYFRGMDASAFSLVSGFPVYSLESGSSANAEIRFVPSRIGLHSAIVVIITQADTLNLTIVGEGVQPRVEIVSKIIDFGKVVIGNSKDSLRAVTIKNLSPVTPVTINLTKHNKPNDIDFTTIAGGGTFILGGGQTKKMDLRFTPSDAGRTSGTLEFYFDGIGSPLQVQLFGEGIKNSPKISANLSSFPDMICLNSAQTDLTISNTGGNPLFISKIAFSGANSTDFSVPGFTPLTIEKDSSKKLTVLFIPSQTGIRSASLDITCNSDPDSVISIPVTGRKDSVSLSSSTNIIDLGILCPNETKDTTFLISNTGTVEASAKISSLPDFTVNTTLLNLKEFEKQNVSLHFSGRTNEGIISETIKLTDTLCNFTKEITIKGIIQKPVITANDISIVSFVGSFKDEEIVLENTSDRDLTINNPPTIADNRFVMISPVFPMFIPAKSRKTIQTRYTPTDTLSVTIKLTFEASPCSIQKDVTVTGSATESSAILMIGSADGKVGDIIEIPVYLKNPIRIIQSGTTGFEADLSFNSTLLVPMEEPKGNVLNGKRIIPLNLQITGSNNDELTRLKFFVCLGSDSETALALDNIKSINGKVSISKIDGNFKLLGICYEGGKRLIEPDGKIGVITLSPNPANDEINITFSSIEKALTEIIIYNILGEKVITAYSEVISKPEIRNITVPTASLSAGTYMIIFRTQTILESYNLYIIKK